jgi:hypothetical protein
MIHADMLGKCGVVGNRLIQSLHFFLSFFLSHRIAATFLRYEESLYLAVDREGDFEPEKLRRSLVLALHFGLKLVLDLRERADLTLSDLIDEENFPSAIFEKEKIMDESVWRKLWKDEYQTLLDQDASVLSNNSSIPVSATHFPTYIIYHISYVLIHHSLSTPHPLLLFRRKP